LTRVSYGKHLPQAMNGEVDVSSDVRRCVSIIEELQ
jgi:hypothetical protein